MPRYESALEVRFNIVEQHRWEVYDAMPTIADFDTVVERGLNRLVPTEKRDGWVFFVREDQAIVPYYFDARTRRILPFSKPVVIPQKIRCLIGNGKDREIIVTHGLNSLTVEATAWEARNNRLYKVECEIFKFPGDGNRIGFWFSEPPGVDAIEVVIG
jgi:hypothetical protein